MKKVEEQGKPGVRDKVRVSDKVRDLDGLLVGGLASASSGFRIVSFIEVVFVFIVIVVVRLLLRLALVGLHLDKITEK